MAIPALAWINVVWPMRLGAGLYYRATRLHYAHKDEIYEHLPAVAQRRTTSTPTRTSRATGGPPAAPYHTAQKTTTGLSHTVKQ